MNNAGIPRPKGRNAAQYLVTADSPLPPPRHQLRPTTAYSFIATNADVSTPAKAAAAEAWHRMRTDIEDRIRDAKHGAALRHLPSGNRAGNSVWMWGALLAVNLSAWLQELAGLDYGDGRGRAHLGTLRHRLLNIPARLVRHAGQPVLRLPPGPAIAGPGAGPGPAIAGPGAGPVTQPARLDLTTPGPSPASSHHGDPRTRRYRAVCAPTTRTAPHSIDAQEFMPNTRPLPADPGQTQARWCPWGRPGTGL